MSTEIQAAIEKAIVDLPYRSVFKKGSREFEIRSLRPFSAWMPFTVTSWKKKDASVIGEDSCGNLYLRTCDDSVLFWDHETEEDELLSPSVHGFLSSLSAPAPVELKPGQVKRVWIDPAFLEEQKKKGNA